MTGINALTVMRNLHASGNAATTIEGRQRAVCGFALRNCHERARIGPSRNVTVAIALVPRSLKYRRSFAFGCEAEREKDTSSTLLRRDEKALVGMPAIGVVEPHPKSPFRPDPAALIFCRAAKNAGINALFPKNYPAISISYLVGAGRQRWHGACASTVRGMVPSTETQNAVGH